MSEIRQVSKSGSVVYKPISDRVDVSVQIQVVAAVKDLKYKNASRLKSKLD